MARVVGRRPEEMDLRLSGTRRRLLRWYRENGRHSLPWRAAEDPWHVLLAEVLLQRTRADLVVPVYLNLVRRYPTAEALADAPADELAICLQPLGLKHRSVRLQAIAEAVRGGVPRTLNALLRIHGVGRYAATATLVFAYGRRLGVIDAGVYRVLARMDLFQTNRSRPRDDPAAWTAMAELVRGPRARHLNFAVLDLAALVCRPEPRCDFCPLQEICPTGGGYKPV